VQLNLWGDTIALGLQRSFGMQQTVRLLGDLGERYGSEHRYYNLRSPAEAIKLLCINKPELMKELCEAHEHGIEYRLIQASEDLGYEELHLPLGSNDLILTPVVGGSGGGTTKILIGVALVAAAIIAGPVAGGFLGLGAGLSGTAAGVAVSGLVGGAFATAIGAIGASLILGGVAQLLSPQAELPTLNGPARLRSAQTDGPQSIVRGSDGRQSYAYTGAANTVGVGATIPVAYGEVLIGSSLLSATVDVADESDPLKTAIKRPGVSTFRYGNEKLTGRFQRIQSTRALQLPVSRAGGTNIGLVKGNEVKLLENNDDEGSYDVIFTLSKGLFKNVSGPGSTLIDGFITYKIRVELRIDGPNPDVATEIITVQGLLLSGQTVVWGQRVLAGTSLDDDGNRVYVEIIDFDLDPSCTLNAYTGHLII
jgi:predicted phage tail protein